MRELAIGDIHGCARALQQLLGILEPQPEDTVILLGDYIDRGPDSCGVVETILDLSQRCHLIALGGNHEQMMLGAVNQPQLLIEWLKHGGDKTLESYERHGYPRGLHGVPETHWQFFTEQTLAYWETASAIYVHAALDPRLELQDQPDSVLLWERFTDPMVHKSGKQVICGHTAQKTGLPALFKKGICIDTWVYGAGWLTGYDVTNGTFTQANERGLDRTFDLKKLAV